ncbi:MAG TPA: bifunctional diaminohydroxyphosphoribosylaminopyrimidine deaminase/5-amino-6-(5-phosphoribosylamino)uracil reductase RibD [Gemmata sp.]|nr:bifunctional diaminohydroxyphosphoribosylaminopyrimidine deaminase/5-amino-6-(5-phosphoribosylamino)uracil reductase RibD [Gemmata sp.]
MDNLERWMQAALALAIRGRGYVEPNPLVGAIVLDSEGLLAGEGWHQNYGGPHAEIHALNAAGERAKGGTLLVTLEPCCHWGKTPPCTDAVIKSGVRRVIAAMADPFPQVAGGGLKLLRDAGLEVQVGICEAEAKRLNAAYLKLLKTGKPWVHLKWAMTLDGKITTRTGDSKWISCEESRRRVHELRGCMDAIVVGRGTVVADDPMLTARPPGPRIPTRVVITASGDLPERSQLRATAREVPVIVFTASGNEEELSGWKIDGAEIVGVPRRDNGLSLDAVLENLGKRRFTHVLVEGGAGILGSFVDAGVGDEFHVFVAPKIVGGNNAPSPIAAIGIERMADALRLVEFTSQVSGDDVYLHGYAASAIT